MVSHKIDFLIPDPREVTRISPKRRSWPVFPVRAGGIGQKQACQRLHLDDKSAVGRPRIRKSGPQCLECPIWVISGRALGAPITSDFRGKADVPRRQPGCPKIAKSGHRLLARLIGLMLQHDLHESFALLGRDLALLHEARRHAVDPNLR